MLFRWAHGDRFILRAPLALVEYPFEVSMACFAVLAGIPLLLGVEHTSAIKEVFPLWGEVLWAVLMLVAGMAMTYGLLRHVYDVLAHGLELFGAVMFVWAGSILYSRGVLGGIPGGPLLTFMAGVCYMRSWWLQARERLLARMEKASSQ